MEGFKTLIDRVNNQFNEIIDALESIPTIVMENISNLRVDIENLTKSFDEKNKKISDLIEDKEKLQQDIRTLTRENQILKEKLDQLTRQRR